MELGISSKGSQHQIDVILTWQNFIGSQQTTCQIEIKQHSQPQKQGHEAMKAPLLKISSHTVSSFFSFMASTTAPQASYAFLLRKQNCGQRSKENQLVGRATARKTNKSGRFGVFAAQEPRKRQRAPPGVDTRIHWDNPDEGWIGGSSNSQQTQEKLKAGKEQNKLLGEKFADLLNYSSHSHYQ